MTNEHNAPIKSWPPAERPRERLLSYGAENLTDGELLALILGASARSAGGVISTAWNLLTRFGGLEGLGRCHLEELMQVPGIGEARACALIAVTELARRLESARPVRGTPITCSSDAFRIVKRKLSRLDHEIFLTLALDAKNRVLAANQVAQGSATSVEVHPREVFSPVIRGAASFVIVAHNHPSGDPEPSSDDRQLTLRLMQAGEILGIPLLDHLVVGEGAYVSLADRGLM